MVAVRCGISISINGLRGGRQPSRAWTPVPLFAKMLNPAAPATYPNTNSKSVRCELISKTGMNRTVRRETQRHNRLPQQWNMFVTGSGGPNGSSQIDIVEIEMTPAVLYSSYWKSGGARKLYDEVQCIVRSLAAQRRSKQGGTLVGAVVGPKCPLRRRIAANQFQPRIHGSSAFDIA